MKKVLAGIVVGVVLLGSAALVLSRRPSEATRAEESAAKHDDKDRSEIELTPEAIARAGVRWEAARVSTFEQGVEATATVAADAAAVHHVRLAGRGKVDRLLVRIGDAVKVGDPLLTYENHEIVTLQNELSAARSSLAKAEASASVAANALQRAKSLLDLGAIPKAEVEKRSVDHRAALSDVEIEKSHVDKTLRLLARAGATPNAAGTTQATLQSPFAGTVTATDVSPGELRDPAEDVITITNLAKVWIIASVYERDIAAVRRGQRVPVRFEAYAGQDFMSQVTSIGDVVDPETRTIKVRCEVDNQDRRLKLGMFGKAIVATGASRQAIVIPAAALQTVLGQPTVYIRMPDGHFRPMVVEPGERRGNRQEIQAGIEPGNLVVVSGAFALKSESLEGDLHVHADEGK